MSFSCKRGLPKSKQLCYDIGWQRLSTSLLYTSGCPLPKSKPFLFHVGSASLSLSWSLRVIVLTFFCVFFATIPASTFADAPPTGTRPYIELPFPRDSRYEVTCGYGCYQHKGSMTYAVDFDVAEGDPIVAAAAGEVMAVTWEVGLPVSLGLGDALIVYIDHGNGWFTRYVHMQGVTVETGDHVDMGDVIGYSGKTGASGAHLHFELKYGTSLHSPSVPISELFDGNPPEEGQRYLSNNQTLTKQEPTPTPDTTLRSVIEPTTTPEYTNVPALPFVTSALELSKTDISVGESITATFTLRNNTSSRLQLAMLGVAGHDESGTALRADTLFFDRSIILNPGREYKFRKHITLSIEGAAELFVFALGPDNEWLPLGGAVRPVGVNVMPPALTHTVYLPIVHQQAEAGRDAAIIGESTDIEIPVTDTPVIDAPQPLGGVDEPSAFVPHLQRP